MSFARREGRGHDFTGTNQVGGFGFESTKSTPMDANLTLSKLFTSLSRVFQQTYVIDGLLSSRHLILLKQSHAMKQEFKRLHKLPRFSNLGSTMMT